MKQFTTKLVLLFVCSLLPWGCGEDEKPESVPVAPVVRVDTINIILHTKADYDSLGYSGTRQGWAYCGKVRFLIRGRFNTIDANYIQDLEYKLGDTLYDMGFHRSVSFLYECMHFHTDWLKTSWDSTDYFSSPPHQTIQFEKFLLVQLCLGGYVLVRWDSENMITMEVPGHGGLPIPEWIDFGRRSQAELDLLLKQHPEAQKPILDPLMDYPYFTNYLWRFHKAYMKCDCDLPEVKQSKPSRKVSDRLGSVKGI